MRDVREQKITRFKRDVRDLMRDVREQKITRFKRDVRDNRR